MTISAAVVCDSISSQGIRLTTLQLRYPKFIHSEFMTHRVFSRNASSSRAIPVERMIADVLEDPAMPVFWGKNRPGMQAVEEMSEDEKQEAIAIWLSARTDAVRQARRLSAMGAHKQIVNRVIEPWCHINVVVTATDWANFFALRRHEAAQPEIHALADAMWDALDRSEPTLLRGSEWHLPYFDKSRDMDLLPPKPISVWGQSHRSWLNSLAIKLSVARCARVSYLTHDGKTPDVDADLRLYDRLISSVPMHASPAEHQATPDHQWFNSELEGWVHQHEHGNFRGWRQYRKMLPNEHVPG